MLLLMRNPDCSTVLLPTAQGATSVFEPKFLNLFQDLQKQAALPGGLRFCHILRPSDAPPALLADPKAPNGFPRIGVLATATAIETRDNGTLLVQYEGLRRLQLLNIWETEPYTVAYAMYFADDDVLPEDQCTTDELELALYRQLLEVASLSSKLECAGAGLIGSALPDALIRYAPPPPATRTMAQALIDAGYVAGHNISMWQRHGSVYDKRGSRSKEKISHDPYQLVREQVGRKLRQELFSFAAASVIDAGVPERLALLNSGDTAARLQWVAMAVQPYLDELRAKVMVMKALKQA